MIKQVLTAIGMFVSTVSFSEGSAVPENKDPNQILETQFESEILESCGHLLPATDEYSQCVKIVTIDFTVLPHNQGGGSTCPGPCSTSK